MNVKSGGEAGREGGFVADVIFSCSSGVMVGDVAGKRVGGAVVGGDAETGRETGGDALADAVRSAGDFSTTFLA